jgi:hypothetical protein
MGYSESGGAFRQAGRQVIFLGDFIDRGPQQLRTLELARGMVDGGSALAVMGNHEFNAIAFVTPDPETPGEFLRTHHGEKGRRHRKQHRAFLEEVGEGSPRHLRWVDWFRTLPLWLDLPGLRVVHACWHEPSMTLLAPRLAPGHLLDDSTLVGMMQKPIEGSCTPAPGPSLYRAAETILKGLEVRLPDGHAFEDKDGHSRTQARVRWWDPGADTFRKAAITTEDFSEGLPDAPISAGARLGYEGVKPVFFGHYWMRGTPVLLTPKAVCLDYGVGKGGPLCAYRWSGEATLKPENICATES